MYKVMIVDDEIMVRIGMKSIIDWEKNDFTVISECANGKEALESIARQKPDLILTDLMMPEIDGFGLMEQCARKYPDIRFVILSNYNDFENTRRAIQNGALDYIFKLTISPEELLKVLRQVSTHLVKTRPDSGKLLKKNKTAIKSYLIRCAAEGSCSDWTSLGRDLMQVAPQTDFRLPYRVMHITLDMPGKHNMIPNLQLIKYGAENMIEEIMCRDQPSEVYSYILQDLLIIFNTGRFPSDADVFSFSQEKFQVIQEYLQRYYAVATTGALSDRYQGLQSLPEAVQQTGDVLRYRMRRESGTLHTSRTAQREELRNARKYVYAHLSEPIMLEAVASSVNMSTSYFSHMFHEENGITFTDYVNQVRLHRACELLRYTRKKIADIALEVGMENVNYFSVLFKRFQGETPSVYRRNHQEETIFEEI